jgi:hypothetical protein
VRAAAGGMAPSGRIPSYQRPLYLTREKAAPESSARTPGPGKGGPRRPARLATRAESLPHRLISEALPPAAAVLTLRLRSASSMSGG